MDNIKRAELEKILAEQVDRLGVDQRRWWDLISITPELWNHWKYDDVAYWVVAIFGRRVFIYDEVERDWGLTKYFDYGILGRWHWMGYEELEHLINNFRDYANDDEEEFTKYWLLLDE